MSTLSDQCVGRWPGILEQLGIEARYLSGKHSDCPICDTGKDRWRFDNKKGRGDWICSVCGFGDGFDLLMRVKGYSFKEAAKEVEDVVGDVEQQPARQKADPRIVLNRIGSGLLRLTGKDPASLYLRNRGLQGIASYGLRYHPELAYFDKGQRLGIFPAMVAKICNAAGHGETYHITYLTPDGQKADVPAAKKVMPPINTINGGAIRLSPVAEHIGITEGIENGLAAMEGEGLACWAAVSAGGIETFEPPQEVRRITIFADNDNNYRGQKAAYILANRLVQKSGLSVDVVVTASDYLDQLVSTRRNAA